MARAIDVMTLDEAIKHCEDIDACDSCKAEHLQLAEWLKELKRYREQPTIEAETVKHGKWMQRDSADYECTECGFRFTSADPISMFEFCRCGARMDGE